MEPITISPFFLRKGGGQKTENNNRLNRVMFPEKVLDTGKYKKINKGKNSKIKQGKVMFFCTALLFNEIYLSIKLCDDISYSFRVMSWVKFKV
jgi:hypothetical protein